MVLQLTVNKQPTFPVVANPAKGTFVQRVLKPIFVLGQGDFGTAGSNTVELTGLRISAHIENAGGRSMGSAMVRIWGMTKSKMDQLSTLGMVWTATRKNSFTLTAGDTSDSQLATVFQGTIKNAWADYSQQPNVAFLVDAHTGTFEAVRPAQPISISGSADVAQLLSGLATQMNMRFINHGVMAKLPGGYYGGSAWNQAQKIVRHAGIEWNAGEKGVLEIWNPGQGKTDANPLVSPETGMIGYPGYTSKGIMLKVLFNPSIGLGTKIEVHSSVKLDSNFWVVYKIDHDLDALLPNGRWESNLLAVPPGQAVVA